MRIVAPAAVFLVSIPFVARAYKDGPAPSLTGGFGEPSCQQCHFDQPLNDGVGMLRVTGVPDRYAASMTYDVRVTLTRPAMTRAGFEISARFASGNRMSQQAGAWRLLDDRVDLVRSDSGPAVEFLHHNAAGSIASPAGMISWTMQWIAPDAAAGPVQFNVAGNAANDDASPLGDYVYTEQVQSLPEQAANASIQLPRARQ